MKNILNICVVLLVFLSVSISAQVEVPQQDIVVSWDAPTTDVSGEPLSDLAGYKVYYGLASGNYTKSIDTKTTNTTYKISVPKSGKTYYVVTTAYDTSGNESGFSNEESKTVEDKVAPSNPTGCSLE